MTATVTSTPVEGTSRALVASPSTTATSPWVLDLVTGLAAGTRPAAITFDPSTPPTSLPAANGPWKRALLKIDMQGYTQANFVVEYEGTPEGWTLNIGDSRTNNGYSGDGGTSSCAEIQVVNNSAVIYGRAYGPGQCRTYGVHNYVLQDGSLKVVVRDQFVSLGQPYSPVQNDEMYRLPDPGNLAGNSDGSNIYAAFNSVVSQQSDRTGKGLRRVMITLQ